MEIKFRLTLSSHIFINRNRALVIVVFLNYCQNWIYGKICVQHGVFPWDIEILYGEWPSGLRHCSKNRKVQTSLGPHRGLGTQPRYVALGDPKAENVKHSD